MAIVKAETTRTGHTASYWRFTGIGMDMTDVTAPKARLTFALFRDFDASETEGKAPADSYSISLDPAEVLAMGFTPMPATAQADFGHLYGYLAETAYDIALNEVTGQDSEGADIPGRLALANGAVEWVPEDGPYPV